jgi:hypothetical protein
VGARVGAGAGGADGKLRDVLGPGPFLPPAGHQPHQGLQMPSPPVAAAQMQDRGCGAAWRWHRSARAGGWSAQLQLRKQLSCARLAGGADGGKLGLSRSSHQWKGSWGEARWLAGVSHM